MTKYKFSRYNWFEFDLSLADGEQLRDMHAWCAYNSASIHPSQMLGQDGMLTNGARSNS